MLLDPGYEFTNLYGLRWDAPGGNRMALHVLVDEHGLVYLREDR